MPEQFAITLSPLLIPTLASMLFAKVAFTLSAMTNLKTRAATAI